MYLVMSILANIEAVHNCPTEGLARSGSIYFCTDTRSAFRPDIEFAVSKLLIARFGSSTIAVPPSPSFNPNVTVCLALCICPRLREHPREHQLVDSRIPDGLLTEQFGMTDPPRYSAYEANTAIAWSQNSRSGALRNSVQAYEFNRYPNPSELV